MTFTEKELDRVLLSLGYAKTRKMTYRALWSTPEVEHFLYFRIYGRPKIFLTASFGVRSPLSERFGVDCALLYGFVPLKMQLEKYEFSDQCTTIIDFGMMSGWAPRGSITLPNFKSGEVGDIIRIAIQSKLMPHVKVISSAMDFYSILVSNDEPFSWFRTTGVIRSAQIAVLGLRLGHSDSKIRDIFQLYSKDIKKSLTPDLSFSEYVDLVLEKARIINF